MSVNQVNQIAAEQNDAQVSAINNELKKIADVKQDQKQFFKAVDKAKADEARHASKMQQLTAKGKSKADNGTKILASLANDFAKFGMDFTQALNNTTISKETEKMLNKAKLSDEDTYSVRNTSTQDAVKGIRKRSQEREQQQQKGDGKEASNKGNAKAFAQEYAHAYVGFAFASTPEAKEKLDDLRSKLGEEGFSDRDIAVLEKGTRKSLRKDMISQIQSCFFDTMLSPEKSFDFIVASKQYKNALGYAIRNSEAFGINDANDVQEYVNKMVSDSEGDLRDFVTSQLEVKLLEKNISHKEVKKDVERLVTLGSRVGFNPDQFMDNWLQKKVDLGLVAPEIFASSKPDSGKVKVAIEGASADGVSERHQYTMTREEEKEILTNRLRALFMKKALTGNLFADIEVTVKVRKTKNGLIKLGLTYEDLHKVEREGMGLARMRSLEQLKEAFMERATFYKLSGGAFELTQKKIKGLTANLKKLELDLSQAELDILRDDANRQMYDHTVVELNWALAVLKKGPNPRLHKKACLMVTVLTRLSEESGFTQAHGEPIGDLINRAENQLRNSEGSA